MDKQKRTNVVTVKLTDFEKEQIDKLIADGRAKRTSDALQRIINMWILNGSK
ncbi:hypothetical protein [Citrobacter farmeri]|uniref:hypothetical protein n=1 Tax=Citrobacter farmeri TaxID=67824 RepID=UPI001902B086|nr:hypothetical protein [Citrobacter farmeri]MBJ9134402.1 hypothetical protein [Citrobacter farmeri]